MSINQSLGVGIYPDFCVRSMKDQMLNTKWNPLGNIKECFGPVLPVNRTEHDLQQNAQFGCPTRENFQSVKFEKSSNHFSHYVDSA